MKKTKMEKTKSAVTTEQEIQLEGEVIAADVENSTGKLLIFENSYLPEDIYSFTAENHVIGRQLFKDAFLNEVKVTCRLFSKAGRVNLRIEKMELR